MNKATIDGSEVKVYARRNLFFLYKYITQYSSSYWNMRRPTILSRMNKKISITWKPAPYAGGWQRDLYLIKDLEYIDNIIKKESLSIFSNRDEENSRSHRVLVSDRSSKVLACSGWAKEFLFTDKKAKNNRQELFESLTIKQLCQAYSSSF